MMGKPQPNQRTKLLARIHCLKRDLRMDDDAYRGFLRGGWSVESAAVLRVDQLAELAVVLAAQLEQNTAGTPKAPATEYPGRPRNMGPMGPVKARRQAAEWDTRSAQLQKIEALLTEANRAWSYADAIAVRICKTTKLQWVSTDLLYKIIAALVKDAERNGRPTK